MCGVVGRKERKCWEEIKRKSVWKGKRVPGKGKMTAGNQKKCQQEGRKPWEVGRKGQSVEKWKKEKK